MPLRIRVRVRSRSTWNARTTAVEAWVTDQGAGFDTATVPDDRKGISESITARMVRSGGESTILSAPGEGTEVHLRSGSR